MLRIVFALPLLAAAPAVHAQPTPASLKMPPPALELFQRDWVLMNWALKYYDANHDILIEPEEAQRAADAFRTLADGDRDGRVTPEEYSAARASILASD